LRQVLESETGDEIALICLDAEMEPHQAAELNESMRIFGARARSAGVLAGWMGAVSAPFRSAAGRRRASSRDGSAPSR
jgi:hypothetical protein